MDKLLMELRESNDQSDEERGLMAISHLEELYETCPASRGYLTGRLLEEVDRELGAREELRGMGLACLIVLRALPIPEGWVAWARADAALFEEFMAAAKACPDSVDDFRQLNRVQVTALLELLEDEREPLGARAAAASALTYSVLASQDVEVGATFQRLISSPTESERLKAWLFRLDRVRQATREISHNGQVRED